MADLAQIDQLADTELSRLQLQNRELKTDIRNLLDEKRSQLVTQNKMINLLNSESEKLQLEYDTLRQVFGAKHQNEVNKLLVNVLDQHTEIHNAYKQEKINLWELEGHIKKVEKQITALQTNKVTDNCYKETILKVQRDVVTLENRLDVVSKKCCAVLAENTKLRQSIDHMLQYRAQFNDLWQELVNQFNNGKKTIMDLIDQSIVAFDHREELCNKLQFVRDKTESDKLVHIQEMRELQRSLEHNAKLQYFYDIKGQKRTNADLEEREINKKIQQREQLEKDINEYKDIIAKIQDLVGEVEIEKLAGKYTHHEEENFAIFNYVNELSSEVETLNGVVRKYIEDIEVETELKKESAYRGETESVVHLETEREIAYKNSMNALDDKTIMDEKHKKLLRGIEQIFCMTETEDAPILSVLGQKNNITGQNIGLIIGIINRRVDNIVGSLTLDDFKILTKKDRVPKFNVKELINKKNK